MNRRLLHKLVLCFAALATLTSVAHADLFAFTDRAAFDAAASGVAVVDFDSESLGDVASGTTIDGITLAYDFGGVSLTITDVYDTTSSPNFLGTDDSDILLGGDDIDFGFAPVSGFGLYIVTAEIPDVTIFSGDLNLTAGGTTATLDVSDLQDTLGDGSLVYFLGVLSDDATSFSSALLSAPSGSVGAFTYNLDDVVVVAAIPEAGMAGRATVVLLLGAISMSARRILCAPVELSPVT